MKKSGWLLLIAAAVAAAVWMVSMPGAGMPGEPRAGEEEAAHPAAQSDGAVIARGCFVTQTMRFTLCGHSVTRRVQAPEGLIGKDFSAARDYYALWQIEQFAADAISMSREIELFCPMHRVLTVSEAGELALGRNLYGDGMAFVKGYPNADPAAWPEEERDHLRLGIPFDTEEEADAFVAAH